MEIGGWGAADRRKVLKGMALFLVGLLSGCLGQGSGSRTRKFKLVEASKLKEGLNEFPIERVAVLKTGEKLSAISLVCTHQTCLIKAAPGGRGFLCPCHGSEFDEKGVVVQGPAKDPLPWYEVRIVDGFVEIDIPQKA